MLVDWPRAGWSLWCTFNQLANVSCAEIDAYIRLHGTPLTPWEVQTIQLFERLAREAGALKGEL